MLGRAVAEVLEVGTCPRREMRMKSDGGLKPKPAKFYTTMKVSPVRRC